MFLNEVIVRSYRKDLDLVNKMKKRIRKNCKKLYKLKKIIIKLGGMLRLFSLYFYFRYEESEI